MGILKSVFGPRSKYDKTIPYTYMARVAIIPDDPEIDNIYFADTVCGLIEYLDGKNIQPDEVEIFGVYLKQETSLDVKYCTDADGRWLKKPLPGFSGTLLNKLAGGAQMLLLHCCSLVFLCLKILGLLRSYLSLWRLPAV